MHSRLAISCVITALVGLVSVACGDDEGGGDEPVGGTGVTAGRSGSSGRGASGAGAAGAGAGGRGARGPVTQMCPMTEPMNGATCTPARGSCTFGTRTCDCISDTSTWACWAPSDCPTTVPAEQSMCPVVGMSCELGMGDDCECEATGWDCGNQFCPAAEPAPGGACEEGSGQCTFGTRICDCTDDVWACWNPSDCPATAPLEDSMCPLTGMVCPFMGGNCTCETGGWDCQRGVMQPDPGTDAGI
jgi:hypothetical protein